METLQRSQLHIERFGDSWQGRHGLSPGLITRFAYDEFLLNRLELDLAIGGTMHFVINHQFCIRWPCVDLDVVGPPENQALTRITYYQVGPSVVFRDCLRRSKMSQARSTSERPCSLALLAGLGFFDLAPICKSGTFSTATA